MSLEDYRAFFIGIAMILMLVGASPCLSLILVLPDAHEQYSELWILGRDHMASDYPFEVRINETERIFVGVGNHMTSPRYYLAYAKFRNQTQASPDSKTSIPSPLDPISEFRLVVAEGGSWETPVVFSISEASRFGQSFVVTKLTINDIAFEIHSLSAWDSENAGFYYQLFFELWAYNYSVSDFTYQNRFVGIWLKLTD